MPMNKSNLTRTDGKALLEAGPTGEQFPVGKKLTSDISKLRGKMVVPILVVEQKVNEVLEISNKVYSLKLGKISF